MTLLSPGELLDRSKQYLSRLEAGDGTVSPALEAELVEALDVLPQFFYELDPMPIVDEQCHFRKQLTTKVALRQFARARRDAQALGRRPRREPGPAALPSAGGRPFLDREH
jgi:hypothetical protein